MLYAACVLKLCKELNLPLSIKENLVCAALLHGLEQDIDGIKTYLISEGELDKTAAEHIAKLATKVRDVTKIPYFPPESGTYFIYNHMNLIIQEAASPEVMLLAFCDRLASISVVGNIPSNLKQYADYVIREAKQIYIPLAERLGLSSVAGELRERIFFLEQRDVYLATRERLLKYEMFGRGMDYEEAKRRWEEDERLQLENELKNLETRVPGLIIETLSLRTKNIYSIREKTQRKPDEYPGPESERDIFGIKILINSRDYLARVLEFLSNRYGVKTVGAEEKHRLYKVYHLNLQDEQGRYIEIQIFWDKAEYLKERTGEYAHWVKKASEETGEKFSPDKVENDMGKLVPIELTGDFFEDFNAIHGSPVIRNWVYVVYHPDGRALRLKRGATSADFASLPRIDRFDANFSGITIAKTSLDLISPREIQDEEEQALLIYHDMISVAIREHLERGLNNEISPGAEILSFKKKNEYLLGSEGEKRKAEIERTAKHLRTILLLRLLSLSKPAEFRAEKIERGKKALARTLGIDIKRDFQMRTFLRPLVYQYDLADADELYICLALAEEGDRAIKERLFDLSDIREMAKNIGQEILEKEKIQLMDKDLTNFNFESKGVEVWSGKNRF